VAQLFEALHYKLEGDGFESRCGHCHFLIIPAALWAVAYQEYFLEVKAVGAYS
jgi:hypothetical protein